MRNLFWNIAFSIKGQINAILLVCADRTLKVTWRFTQSYSLCVCACVCVRGCVCVCVWEVCVCVCACACLCVCVCVCVWVGMCMSVCVYRPIQWIHSRGKYGDRSMNDGLIYPQTEHVYMSLWSGRDEYFLWGTAPQYSTLKSHPITREHRKLLLLNEMLQPCLISSATKTYLNNMNLSLL